MKVIENGYKNQVLMFVFFSIFFVSCSKMNQDITIIPPAAPPLSRETIGYGIMVNSYTHILDEPKQGAVSLGYVRKGTVVPVLERRMVDSAGGKESWVLVKGMYEGWLKEENIDIYENEAQANTASELLN